MNRLVIVGLLALVLALLSPTPARACDYNCFTPGQIEAVAIGAGTEISFLIADLTYVALDAGLAIGRKHPSRGFAISEIVVATTQIGLSALLPLTFLDVQGFDYSAVAPGAIGLNALLIAPLLAHGIWAYTTGRPAKARRVSLLPMPSLIMNGRVQNVGLGFAGRF